MSILIWLIGIITGAVGVKVYEMIKHKKWDFKWYHWVITLLWYFTLLFIVSFVGTSFYEGEPQAAGMAILIFGGILTIITILLYRFIFSKQIKLKNNQSLDVNQ